MGFVGGGAEGSVELGGVGPGGAVALRVVLAEYGWDDMDGSATYVSDAPEDDHAF